MCNNRRNITCCGSSIFAGNPPPLLRISNHSEIHYLFNISLYKNYILTKLYNVKNPRILSPANLNDPAVYRNSLTFMTLFFLTFLTLYFEIFAHDLNHFWYMISERKSHPYPCWHDLVVDQQWSTINIGIFREKNDDFRLMVVITQRMYE